MTRWCIATNYDGNSYVVRAVDKSEAKRALTQLGYRIDDIVRFEFFDQPEFVEVVEE